MRNLKKSPEGKAIKGKFLHLKSCGSTQDVVRTLSSAWGLIQADRQTAGRGQNGRTWFSEPGGLYYSVKIPGNVLPEANPLLLLGAASLWIDELESIYPSLGNELSLKWPNDLLLRDRKLAGFLGEKTSGCIYLGIGVNVNNELPGENYRHPPIALHEAVGQDCSRRELLLSWYRSFVRELLIKEPSEHFDPSNLEERLATVGRPVRKDGASGKAVGLLDSGELEVHLDGTVQTVNRTDELEVVTN